MTILFRVLARVNYEIWATISFACGMIGLPPGQTRDAIEYVARVGITTLFDTAFFACSVGAVFAVPTLFVNAHTAWSLWCLMFTRPMLGIFGTFAFITTLSAIHRQSERYQLHDA